VAYVDTLMWIPTPDPVQAINAVVSGEADFTFDATADAYGRLKDNPKRPHGDQQAVLLVVMVMNKKKGIFSDENAERQEDAQACWRPSTRSL
jgi:ABC-type transport system substrate-binding protein